MPDLSMSASRRGQKPGWKSRMAAREPIMNITGAAWEAEFGLWYIWPAKRIAAILLLGVFTFLLIAPVALARDPESQLPTCCRAHGKHNCMLPADSQSGEPSFQARTLVGWSLLARIIRRS